jgi:dextranase
MIYPSRSFYKPGEAVEIRIPGSFQATIWHLGQCVTEIEGVDVLNWQPPPIAKQGYRVRVNSTLGQYWTAFDVLEHWTDAPRYGYLFNFRPNRDNFDLDRMLAYHVNGIQFYDWMYRHDTLLPPDTLFVDPLGREMSLDATRQLIDEAHTRGMAAMPYTAIYAASPEFAANHADWGLFDGQGVLFDFADGFLKIVNPDSPWRDHFVRECQKVLDALPFDGIHVDQYGEPQTGFDANGEPVNLPRSLAETLQAVKTAIPDGKTLLFNLVHNWPLEPIAKTPVDFLYCELWPPQTTLGDLHDVTTLNWQSSAGRCPVVAVYVDPEYEQTVKLVQSVIMASGGYHLAHGEDGLYLCDPYFPKSQKPSSALAEHLQRIADFGVAYGELLCQAKPIVVKSEIPDDLWLIARHSERGMVLNLLNTSPQEQWNTSITPAPIRDNVSIRVEVDESVEKIWWVSPDQNTPEQDISYMQNGNHCEFIVPNIQSWTLVYLQFASSIESE